MQPKMRDSPPLERESPARPGAAAHHEQAAPADDCEDFTAHGGSLERAIERAVERYRTGTYRDRIIHDLILADAARLGSHLTFLDIGCGRGFDTDVPLQQSLVSAAGSYIGIEPDLAVIPGDHVKDVRRCFLEQVDLPQESVHIAFAIMVLEHLADPQPFWDKLHEVLVPGGVFWALTIDARHWFSGASLLAERLKIKEMYFSWLMHSREKERYDNYPVHYRSNTPQRVERQAQDFSAVTCFNLSRVGQCDGLFPGFLRPLSRRLESRSMRRGKPGTLLAIRAVK